MISPDNLDDAQRFVEPPWNDTASQVAIALALIDIGRTLRQIRYELETR